MERPKIWWTPECELGFTRGQVANFLGEWVAEFDKWMRGQTIALCEGRRYNHDTKQYEPACEGEAHGPVYYVRDVFDFMDGRAPTD